MATNIEEQLSGGLFDEQFRRLYGEDEAASQADRYLTCVRAFYGYFGRGQAELRLLSVPGRSEVGGNHTDHNHGRVLACAVGLDIVAVARKTDGELVRIKSEGFEEDIVELGRLSPAPEEKYHSQSLVRGVCARLKALGYRVGGFEAYTSSQVLKGSGLSSSAAFEVMVALIVNRLYNDGAISPLAMAKAAQYAEREYFGKPCGLMDQIACALGGFITIDFADPENPAIEKLDFDFSKTGHALCIVDTKGSHSDLNEDYAAIQDEMKAVARLLGGRCLRDCDEAEFYRRLPELRRAAGDRAVLRALHFFGENARVALQARALKAGDFETFKRLVIDSGRSSFMYLQNAYSVKNPAEQGLPLALAVSERLLSGAGAWRVHGGGFAGTIQAFVPERKLKDYILAMDALFGQGACHPLKVRQHGAFALN